METRIAAEFSTKNIVSQVNSEEDSGDAWEVKSSCSSASKK